MKRVIKISSILIMTLVAVMLFSNVAMAAFDWSSSINTLSTATGHAKTNQSAQNIVGSIIAVVRIVAVGIAIIMLVTVAMKYMLAAPEGKAEIKKHAVIYIVGAVVLFASSGILGIIADFAKQIS